MIRKLDEIEKLLNKKYKSILSVAAAHNEEVLISIKEAVDMDVIKPILIGNISKIKSISKSINFNLKEINLI